MARIQEAIVLTGFDELARQVNDPQLIGTVGAHLIGKATAIGERAAKERAPQSVVSTITSEVTPVSGRVASTHPAARVIEGGRRPNGPMPPTGPIADWMAKKGIEGSPFVIARGIARRGTKGRFFMRGARKAVRAAMPKLIGEAGAELVRLWVGGMR